MKSSFSKNLAKYVSWLLKSYREIKTSYNNEPDLKVVAFEKNDGHDIVVVKVKNHGLFAKFNIAELNQDQAALNKFSKADQQKIKAFLEKDFYLNDDDETQVKIRSKKLDKLQKKHLFTLEASQDGVKFVKHLYTDELLKNKDIISTLNKEDVYEIAHAEGVESILIENDEIQKAKEEFIKSQNKEDDKKTKC